MILFDLPVYQFIVQLFTLDPLIISVMKYITTLGSLLVLGTAILCVFIETRSKKYFSIFLVANGLGLAINGLLKFIFRRPRPTQTMMFTVEKTYSFPSGHTMMSTIFYGLLIYYCCKYIKNKKLKYLTVCLLSAIIFFVGISRIYLGVHYATDVLGGLIIGIIYLVVFIKFLNKYENKKKSNA